MAVPRRIEASRDDASDANFGRETGNVGYIQADPEQTVLEGSVCPSVRLSVSVCVCLPVT